MPVPDAAELADIAAVRRKIAAGETQTFPSGPGGQHGHGQALTPGLGLDGVQQLAAGGQRRDHGQQG